MRKTYEKIMEKVQVTEEMRHRILQNIDGTVPAKRQSPWRRYLPLAACVLILAVGAISLPHLSHQGAEQPGDEVAWGNGIEEVASLAELEEKVGFSIAEPSLPFAADTAEYSSYWGEMAQIDYIGAENSASFRKSAGEEDNSGDYSGYDKVETLSLDGMELTLKGDADGYRLAIWRNQGYAYSIRFENSLDWDGAAAVLMEIAAASR